MAGEASRIVLLGAPGSGKGTQAAILAEALSVPAISTGEMLRAAVAAGSELGRRVEAILNSGELVDDATMADVVRDRLAQPDARRGFLLDGYPRTLAQADTLASILDGAGAELDAVVQVKVPVPELVRRALERRREDDTAEVINNRLAVYEENTAPLVEHYRRQGLLRSVDGDQPIEDVAAAIMEVLGSAGLMVLKAQGEIDLMDEANAMVHAVLDAVAEKIAPGVTTRELDTLAEDLIRSSGGVPAFLNYRGYPATLCTSINDVIVHGIPGETELREGDIVGVDCGVLLKGYYGDAARTFAVGAVSSEARRLMDVTRRSLHRAVEKVRPGGRLSDIGYAVQAEVEGAGFTIVREFVGHGIGSALHEDPQVPNFGRPGRGPRLKPGLVLAIEPMVNAGQPGVSVDADGWTARTADGSLSAHFEFSVAVTEEGPRVLGRPEFAVAA